MITVKEHSGLNFFKHKNISLLDLPGKPLSAFCLLSWDAHFLTCWRKLSQKTIYEEANNWLSLLSPLYFRASELHILIRSLRLNIILSQKI